jgi:tetratricopeptide (TPR) repeat protein
MEDDSGASNAYRLLGYMEISRGSFEAAEDAFERSLEHAQRAGDQEAEAVARRAALDTLWLGAVPVAEAIERLKAHLDWAQQHGNRLNEAATLATLGAELAMHGEFESARASLDKSKEILWDLGLEFYVAWISYEVSTVEFLAGEPKRAEDHLREAYATLDKMGDKGTLSTVAALLAEALYRQGSYDEAEHFTDLAEEAAAADDVMSHVRLKATRAKVLATRGEASIAMSLARESVALAEGSGFWNLHADVLMDLAEITRTGTRPDEARVPTERALELYEKKGNVVAAEIARGKLSQIVAP